MKLLGLGHTSRENGFTLIEFIMSFVIIGIVSAITGMGFVSMIHGYVIAKGNAATSQNAQIVLTRLCKELSSTDTVTSGSATSITFKSQSRSPAAPLVLSWDSVNQEISLGGDILANHVQLFGLSYYDKYDDVTASASYLPASTAIIKITLSLAGADNVSTNFEERIFLSKAVSGI